MARNKASGGPTMPGNQQTLLYILPVVFAVFGLKFPLGVLLYWLTTNVWSMAQQHFVIGRMDRVAAAGAAAGKGSPAVTPAGPPPGAKPARPASPPVPPPASPASPDRPANQMNGPKPGGTPRRPPGRNKRKGRGRR
jgi:YidC/Oxa1 family membrane protein insertase